MNDDITSPGRKPRFGTKDRVATFGSGRTCAEDPCETVLSLYNAEDRCGVHSSEKRRR